MLVDVLASEVQKLKRAVWCFHQPCPGYSWKLVPGSDIDMDHACRDSCLERCHKLVIKVIAQTAQRMLLACMQVHNDGCEEIQNVIYVECRHPMYIVCGGRIYVHPGTY